MSDDWEADLNQNTTENDCDWEKELNTVDDTKVTKGKN